jgi:acetyl esterase/lipase
MKHLLRFALQLAAAALGRGAPVDALNASIDPAGLTILRDIPYGPAPRQAMDVYRAADATKGLPVVVFFYGGSWQTGRRQDYLFVAASLARFGMIAVIPDYRLFPQVVWPAYVKDAAYAVAAVRRQVRDWGGDPDRVFVAGHSAGAHLAALLALDPHWLEVAGDRREALAGMVGLGGPYDFLPIQDEDVRAVFAAALDLAATQPINHVDGRNPPVLLLHGEADRTCYPRNSHNLATRIRAAGGPVELRTYRRVGHIGIVLGFAPLFRFWSPAVADLVRFVRRPPIAHPS